MVLKETCRRESRVESGHVFVNKPQHIRVALTVDHCANRHQPCVNQSITELDVHPHVDPQVGINSTSSSSRPLFVVLGLGKTWDTPKIKQSFHLVSPQEVE